jgi:SAM-dependent methyltransferase
LSEIYRAYRSFQQYGGPEQHVVDAASGDLRPRSQVLLDRLSALPTFPGHGTVLDVGCGGGATLRAFSERGDWRLFGHEIDGRNLALLQAIPGFESLFTGEIREIPGWFDAVTMVHSLEHFPDPAPVLRDLRAKISSAGRLFVEVPDASANPLEYLIADHIVHFTSPTLALLAGHSGFVVESISNSWVSKELSMVAHEGDGANPSLPRDSAAAADEVHAHIAWLECFLESAREAASGPAPFGIFGSTIAASWLCGVLGPRVSFFVEEDHHRVGHTHLDRPILSPAQVPSDAVVFLALVPKIADKVAARLASARFDVSLPPSTSAPVPRRAEANRPHRGQP